MSDEPKKYGFVSHTAIDHGMGTSIYSTPDGGEVEVSAVSLSPTESGVAWPDIKLIGEVVTWLRPGQVSVFKQYRSEIPLKEIEDPSAVRFRYEPKAEKWRITVTDKPENPTK